MSLILNFNDRTETVDFPAAFDDYCCLFDEICKIITEIFNLTDLQCDYLLVYYDPLYNLWINLNIHVTKRITNLIRQSSSRTLKIRIERRRKNHATTAIETNTIDNELNKRIYENRCAHITIWLDEHIGSNHWHKKLKRDCRAMINTNTNFIIDDDIDTLIQYNSRINHSESKWPSNFQYPITNCSCPFQCDLLTVDNTDTFFSYLQVTSKLARSMSIIISMHFAKETLPIILSWQQKQLLPNVLLLYVLSSNLLNDYDWAVGYVRSDRISNKTSLLFFQDEKELFVRLINDISRHLTLEADTKREKKDPWYALQYYLAARQLFLNSTPWNRCYSFKEYDHLNQLINESEQETTACLIKTFYLSNESDDHIPQQCIEIFEGI